ncbi:glutaredoxin [Candidatus Kaiserbacteria bacterium]|nr:MAG: glutaredoxin [Candidatus Kaiserbacteria bacterium]
MRNILSGLLLFIFAFSLIAPALTIAHEGEETEGTITVHVFKRDDCTYCKAEKKFIDELERTRSDLNFTVEWHDIVTDEADNSLYQQITTLKRVPRITPITIVGDTLIQGFDAPETTGERIIDAINRGHEVGELSLSDFISGETLLTGSSTAGCDSGDVCLPDSKEFTFKLPFLGVVNLQTFSLSTLAIVLGTVDGFNPCAMWVLITFLLILLQIGDKRKMLYIAGLFILAEAVMYGLILNVWYTTWDFVGLDNIVTPLIGLLAIGGGIFFLYRWHKSTKALTCDITTLETQGKIQAKIQKLAQGPLTIAAIGGIIAVAFSVNIIEFACSVGIPQAFTKILELNQLDFLQTQAYTLLYIAFYMLDDFIVFGLALWGFNKIHAAEKYSRASMLVGGLLMILLGVLLTFAPNFLTF